MLHRLRGVALGLGLVLAHGSAPLAQTPPTLEITDFAPESAKYPNGPRVTVRNHSHVGPLEAWVIRHQDGAIVRKYRVVFSGGRWPKDLEVTEPKGDRLPGLVEGENVKVPFTLVFLSDELVVKLSRGFFVRVKSSEGWETAWTATPSDAPSWPSARVAGGRLTAIKDDLLYVVTRAQDPALKLAFNTDTKVIREGSASPTDVKGLTAGDYVSVAYAESKGTMVAKEVFLAKLGNPPSVFTSLPLSTRSTPPYFESGMQFHVGWVVGHKRVPRVPPNQGEDLIVEIRTPRGSNRWRITQDTEVVAGAIKVSQGDQLQALLELATKTEGMIAVGARELKGSPILAVRILLLQDLSAPR